jgi:hypothetical protein
MATVRTLVSWISAGALIGLFFASLIGPKFLNWYNAPGLGQALCDCVKMTEQITSRLLELQVEGAGAGAFVFLIIGIILVVRKRKQQPSTAAA